MTGGTAHRSAWLDLGRRSSGMWAFMLHRFSSIGLTVYLYLHLAVLSLLRRGPLAWDDFLALIRSPLVLFLDGVLLFGVLFHALNGLRLILIGLNFGLRWQRQMFWVCLSLALAGTAGGVALAARYLP